MYSGAHQSDPRLSSSLGLRLDLDPSYEHVQFTDAGFLTFSNPQDEFASKYQDELWTTSFDFTGPPPEIPVQPTSSSNSINPAFISSMLTLGQMPGSPVLLPSPLSDAHSSPERLFSAPNSTASLITALPSPEVEYNDEQDLYVPSENGDDDDDEYHPSVSARSTPSRKRRTNHSTAGGRKARTLSPAPKERVTPYTTAKSKRKRAPPPSRVHQVTGKIATLMLDALNHTDVAFSLNFRCPDELCTFLMKDKPRMPDFRRHLKAHLRVALKDMGKGHICKGIPYEEFENLDQRRQTAIQRGGEGGGMAYEIQDEMWIGGCRYSFSRGDALTRHVKSRANPCIGMVSGRLEGI